MVMDLMGDLRGDDCWLMDRSTVALESAIEEDRVGIE